MLTLLLALSAARADIAPPRGLKTVPYSVRVENLAAFPDYALIVYPWSLSNGAPTAEVAEVREGEPLGFGRRISGQPAFYAIPRADLAAWQAARPADDREAAEALVAGGKLVRCLGATIDPQHTVEDGAPDFIEERYRVVSIAPGSCEVAKSAAAPAAAAPPAPTPGSATRCGAVGVGASSLGVLLALAGAARRRA